MKSDNRKSAILSVTVENDSSCSFNIKAGVVSDSYESFLFLQLCLDHWVGSYVRRCSWIKHPRGGWLSVGRGWELTDYQSGSRGLSYIGLFSLLLFLIPFLPFMALILCVTDVLSLVLFTECIFLVHISTIDAVVAPFFWGTQGIAALCIQIS